MSSTRISSAWPYLFALCVACILVFPTAQMLSLSDLSPEYRLVATACAFVAMASGLMLYVRCCIDGRFAKANRAPAGD